MRLSFLCSESTVAHLGALPHRLGNGEDYTLHYGGVEGLPPFLYAKFPLTIMRSVLRNVSKKKIIPPRGNSQGYFSDHGVKIDLAHVGESHCTVAMGFELGDDPERGMIDAGLFDAVGNGIEFPMRLTGDYFIGRSKAYADSAHPDGPVIVGAEVDAPLFVEVRRSIGLTDYPVFKGGGKYIPHVTVGFAHDIGGSIKGQMVPSKSEPQHV